MSLSRFFGSDVEIDDDMARTSQSSPLNNELVASYVRRLRAVKTDQRQFKSVLDELAANKIARPAEIAAIANTYGVAGIKATSRKGGLEKISKRFLELVRTDGKLKIAEKFRPW